jgi:hypothetical protein
VGVFFLLEFFSAFPIVAPDERTKQILLGQLYNSDFPRKLCAVLPSFLKQVAFDRTFARRREWMTMYYLFVGYFVYSSMMRAPALRFETSEIGGVVEGKKSW